MGFDDNIEQTPDNREDIPDQIFTEVIPAQPEIAVFKTERIVVGFRPVAPPGPGPFPGVVPIFQTVQKKVVLRPAEPERVIETEIPGLSFPDRTASVVTRLDLHGDVQWANARTLFTMDLRGGVEYYWNRDQDPLDYTGNFALTYLRRLSPKAQVTATASLAYQSQPDYGQVNLINTAGTSGSYFVGSGKLDLSYRWTPRISSVTSLSGTSIIYEGTQSASSYWDVTLGNEIRYIQSPRTTWVVEGRYSLLTYLEGTQSALRTIYLLLGADWTLSRRMRATIRIGESLRTFDTGAPQQTPYAETSVIYQPNRRNQFSMTGRYGFEQTTRAEDENVTARISAAYSRTFNPRLIGSLSLNYVRTEVTSVGASSSSSEVYDAGLYLQYTFNRHFSVNARYSYTLSQSSLGAGNYDRSRFFLTGVYDF